MEGVLNVPTTTATLIRPIPPIRASPEPLARMPSATPGMRGLRIAVTFTGH
ncbi:hypothetical protein [Embleya sp. NPDC050493]|uniref:hypothetical protein n=1 Tax=Embleya sp. NPDC050493 TaxID=3363989 RepID=UPI0037BBC171